jgi:hypothetical protein
MRKIFIALVVSLVFIVVFGCSHIPQDKPIAKIGNAALLVSDAEFLASIRPEPSRNKAALVSELQQTAEARRKAEIARIMFAGELNSIQKDLAESEDARLGQVYFYFYLQANMRHSNKALLDYYKKNQARYADLSMLSDGMPLASFREKIAADLFLEENPALAAQVNDSNKAAIIDSCRRAISNSEFERLKSLYNVELVKIEPPNLEEFYKSNPDEFKTKTAYKLLGLFDLDSAVLVKKIKGISTREEFAKIATELPIAKQGHAIMSVGMFPALDAEISNLGAKKFTQILRAPDTQAYYVFYIDSIIAPELKSFDRSKSLVKSILESKGDFPLDSSFVLATIGGKPFVTEKDILEEKEKIHPMRRASFRRAMILEKFIEKKLYARAAKENGIDKSAEYIAWLRQITDQAYAQVLTDSVLTGSLGVPEDSLKAAYEAEKDSLFVPRSFEDSRMDVAVWVRTPDISYRREFALNRQNYENATSWESAKRAIYRNIKYRELAGIQARLLSSLQKTIPIAIIDTSWGLEFAAETLAELSAQAKAQYDTRNLQKAKTLWERAKILFPENDSLQKAISYELANVYQELGSYAMSVEEYKVITKLWESDPDAYKAYFMQGFVLNEYEKKDSLALIVFEEMLKKFPNSELSDDARIMVDNIKSGGKILEDLIKKIEASSETEVKEQ